MAAVVRDLLASPLGDRYALDVLVSHRTRDRLGRIAVFVRALWRLSRWCRGAGSRIVHVHSAVRGSMYRKALCVAVAKSAGRPVVLQLHAGAGDIEAFDASLGRLRRALVGHALRRADRVVSVSAPGAERIERCFGVHGVVVIPNAAPAIRAARGARDPDRPVRALYMGGFVNPVKGGAVLIEALPRLLAGDPNLEVAFAGTGTPPDELLEAARRHEGVSWLGWLDAEAKAEQLERCDVFVMPSLSEGMPIALLEAMAYGCAIVASAVGGVPEVVADGSEAVLVPPSDPAALADAVARTAADPALRARLGAAAHERIGDFDAGNVYDRFAALYDELLALPGATR